MSRQDDGYDGRMDPECIALCDALNEIPTLETVESCSGHGKRPMMIFFLCAEMRWMMLLGRALDRRYGGYGFRCTLDTGDLPVRGLTFILESVPIGRRYGGQDHKQRGSDKGEAAYAAAVALAERVRSLLSPQARHVRHYYGILLDSDREPTEGRAG
jgi:hypothetical protein